MTRREALKKMGMVAAGIRLGIGGTNATDMLGLSEKEEKREKNEGIGNQRQFTKRR